MSDDIFSSFGRGFVAFAHTRAADLVGYSFSDSGKLIVSLADGKTGTTKTAFDSVKDDVKNLTDIGKALKRGDRRPGDILGRQLINDVETRISSDVSGGAFAEAGSAAEILVGVANASSGVAFLEFATIYGNDWLVAPIDLPRGVLAQVTAASYRTTFNETIDVPAASNQGRRGAFALFSTTGPKGPEPCFIIPPNSRSALEGACREEVVFARDETANVVWAIERSVEGADGMARDRSREELSSPSVAKLQPGADYAWDLETLPPAYWIPMLPIPNGGAGGFFLRKGAFGAEDQARGRLLAPEPFDLFDEKAPREGVRLRRIPSLLRDEHGRLARWIARRSTTAWGEARSKLSYDSTRLE
jgi:hypothetical protein